MPSSWEPAWLEELEARPSEAEDPGYKFDAAAIVDLLPRLDPMEQQLVDMAVFQGLTQRVMADRIGRTQPAVTCRLQHAYALLRWWAEQPPYKPEEILSALPPKTRRKDRYLLVFEGLSLGKTKRKIAKSLGVDAVTIDFYEGRLRRALPPHLQVHLRRPGWPCRQRPSFQKRRKINH